eukprot:scaffold19284_cov36-Cyclotella_meneghiniana.AAC.1
MAMVEAPGGSTAGGGSNHDHRTTHRKLEGCLEKAERRVGSGKNKSPQMARPRHSTTHFLVDGSKLICYIGKSSLDMIHLSNCNEGR